MSPDSIPHLSLGTAVLVIFLVCATFVLLCGLTRMLVATLVLAASSWVAFEVWQIAPAFSVEWFGKSSGFITTGLPIAAFVSSFFLIRKIAKFFSRPFGNSSENGSSPATIPRIAFRLLLALIPTSLLCLIAATLIHHTGSIAEVRSSSKQSPKPASSSPAPLIQKLKALLPDLNL